MRKVATGLTSVPMSSVPGSESSEIDFMEPEDAQAANSGGFNQMEVGSFAKDLELVKQQKKLKKKASKIFTDLDAVKDAALRFGAEVSSENPEDIFKSFLTDIVLKTDVYWGPGDYPADALASVKKKIMQFWENSWKNNSYNYSYKDFLYKNVDRKFLETLAKSVGGGAVSGGLLGLIAGPKGALIGAGIGGAAGLVGGLSAQWNDEVIGQVQDFYNVLVDYKKSYNKKVSNNTAQEPLSGKINYPPGTKLEDLGQDLSNKYSYEVISDSKIKITRPDGTTLDITPDNATENGIQWDEMISALNDSFKTIKKSANFKFNIAKVSKNMKKELINLNSALNGLGYKNIIKIAAPVQLNEEDQSKFEDICGTITGTSTAFAANAYNSTALPIPEWAANVQFDPDFDNDAFVRDAINTALREDFASGWGDTSTDQGIGTVATKIFQLYKSKTQGLEENYGDKIEKVFEGHLATGFNFNYDDDMTAALGGYLDAMVEYKLMVDKHKAAISKQEADKKAEQEKQQNPFTSTATEQDIAAAWSRAIEKYITPGQLYQSKSKPEVRASVFPKKIGFYNATLEKWTQAHTVASPKDFKTWCENIFIFNKDQSGNPTGLTVQPAWTAMDRRMPTEDSIKVTASNKSRIIKTSNVLKFGQDGSVPIGGGTGGDTTKDKPKASGSGGGSSGGSRKSTVETSSSWQEYVYIDDKYSANRKQIHGIWKEITGGSKGAGFTDPEFDVEYKYNWPSYQTWWRNSGRVSNPDVIQTKLQALKDGLAAAGATGQQEVQLDTGKLLNYLTTPLRRGAAAKRDATFDRFKAEPAMKDYIKVYGGDRYYMHPDLATRVLNSGWVKTINEEYGVDTKTNPMLDLALTGLPSDALSGGAATSAGAPQQPVQQRQTGGVANLTIINGKQYYQIPAGKFNLFVKKGEPYAEDGLMMQDTRSGRISAPVPLGKNSPRIREYFGPREIARIKQMVTVNESADAANAYEQVLKGIRMERSGWLRFFTKKTKEKQVETDRQTGRATLERLNAEGSTRQSRLDNLKKKGVI